MAVKFIYFFFIIKILTLILDGTKYYAVASETDILNVLVKPTKLWRFLDKNDEAVLQRFRESIDEYNVGRIKCLRYCIQSKLNLNQDPQFLHLIWKLDKQHIDSSSVFNKDITSEIMQQKSIKSDNPWNQLNKCTFSIVIGCKISQEIEDNFTKIEENLIKSLQPNPNIFEESTDNSSLKFNIINEKVIDENNLTNETKISFYVQNDQTEVNAIIFGNVSEIDLKMPIDIASLGTTTATRTPPRLTLANTRMPDDTNGLRLNIVDPPPGGWRLGIKGVEREPYRLIVGSAMDEKLPNYERTLNYFIAENGKTALEKDRLQNVVRSRQITNYDEKTDQTNDNLGINYDFSIRMIRDSSTFDDQNGQKSFKFPEIENNNNHSSNVNITERMDTVQEKNIDRELKLNNLQRSINEKLPIKNHLIVEVNPDTNLIASPGTSHRIVFDITNNDIVPIRYFYVFRSTHFRFRFYQSSYVQYVDILPGQTYQVAVDIIIPKNIATSNANTVTLQVHGLNTVEKSANIYIRTLGFPLLGNSKPTIDYNFNNNCAGRTSAEKCLKSYWSVDITIQDLDTGLKSINSFPKGIYPRFQYISGTTDPVHFYYSNSCCNRAVTVTAVNVLGKEQSKTIYVEEWNNLSEGEIAAIVMGVLFIILLIILIVILIIYCLNRKESHDLPYSQRYGSRSAPSSK